MSKEYNYTGPIKEALYFAFLFKITKIKRESKIFTTRIQILIYLYSYKRNLITFVSRKFRFCSHVYMKPTWRKVISKFQNHIIFPPRRRTKHIKNG